MLPLHDNCFYLYIIPAFDNFITNAVPIISITDIALNIAKKILKTSPICSNKFIIFLSAIGCVTVANNLYVTVSTVSFNIGIMHIPNITITPTKPTAFFNIIPEPKTVSTASPKIFPTTGTAELTIVFAVLAVIPINAS